jgi:hypothetical protein
MPGPTHSKKLTLLLEWFERNRIEFNSLSIQASPLGGFGLFAQRKIQADDILCKIPKSAILSCKTCGIADVLEQFDLSGSIALTLALMFEKLQGESSPWYGYLQAVPACEPLPLLWERLKCKNWLERRLECFLIPTR